MIYYIKSQKIDNIGKAAENDWLKALVYNTGLHTDVYSVR